MKVKNKLWARLIVLGLVASLSFNACKKDEPKDDSKVLTLTEEQTIAQHAMDEEDFQAASDNADETADKVMSSIGSSGKEISIVKPCDASVDTSLLVSQKQITISFIGTNCNGNGVIRSGKIVLKLTTGNRWIDSNAVLAVTYENFSVTRKAKTIIINGTKTHTNLSGGKTAEVLSGKTIIHKVVSSNMRCKINNTTERLWNVNRLKTFTKEGNFIKLTLTGEGISGVYTNLVTWGTNRDGKAFFTKIETPILMSSECQNGPKSGVKIHYIGTDRIVTTTFGVNEEGVAVTSGCPTHFKIVWTIGNKTYTGIIAY